MNEEQFITQLSQKLADQICELLANSIEEIKALELYKKEENNDSI